MDKKIFSNNDEQNKVVSPNQVWSSHPEQKVFYSLRENIGHYDVACLRSSLVNSEEENNFDCHNYNLGSIVNDVDDDDVSALTECSEDMNLMKLYEAFYFRHHHHIPPAVAINTIPIPVTPNVFLASEISPPSEIFVTVKHLSVPWSPISYKRNRDTLIGSSNSHEEKHEYDIENYITFGNDEKPFPYRRRCNAFDEDDEKRRCDHILDNDSYSFVHEPYNNQRFDLFTPCRYRLSRPSSLHLKESAWFVSSEIDNSLRYCSYPPVIVPPLTPKRHHALPKKRKNFKNISLKKRWALRFRHSF